MPPTTPWPGAAPRRRPALLALLKAGALAALPRLPARADVAPEVPATAPARAPAAPAAPAATVREVARGVYVLQGANAEPDAANAGRVGNLGFVVGERAIAVIDTGSSRARAEELLAGVRRVSPLPVRAAVLTHPAQEFLFGAGLFVDQGVTLLSHPAAPRLIAQRCEHCLDTLRHDLGPARMAGTRLVAPTPVADPPQSIDLGGRRLRLALGPAGTVPANLTVLDEATGVLFAGALLSVARIPGTQDTEPLEWQHALQRLDQPDVEKVVPAYGPVAGRQPGAGEVALDGARQALADYLGDLDRQARALYEQGMTLAELADRCALPRYQGWNGYPATHVHNIFYRYLQLEAADLASH